MNPKLQLLAQDKSTNTKDGIEYICITDIAKHKNTERSDDCKKEAGLNSFTLTPKQWIESTSAIGLISKADRYGGTYRQKDIAFEFASWTSTGR